MLCSNCNTNNAVITSGGNVIYCDPCNNKHEQLKSPEPFVEVIPDRIKAERHERQDSIEQAHLKGELNKRWVDLWGEQAALDKGFSKKEIKKARYVMDQARGSNGGLKYYRDST